MSNAKYKGKDLFITAAGSELVSIGGRGAEMTFGVQEIDYSNLYLTSAVTSVADQNMVEGRRYTVTTAYADAAKAAAVGAGTGGVSTNFTATGVSADANAVLTQDANQLAKATSEGKTDSDILTALIEIVQGRVNTARVQAGSQYAALESAVSYTTDLTAQYELGFNTVNDVNFSMETAHLAKNQILQQAATAMLAQANLGQQGLLQLIQR